MNEINLFTLLRGLLLDGLTAQGRSDVEVKQNFQPLHGGAPAQSQAVVFFSRISDRQYGHAQRLSTYVPDLERFDAGETQWLETTIQCNALAFSNPEDPDYLANPTVSDLINLSARILGSEFAIRRLMAQNVGVYKIENIRTPYNVNDVDRFEMAPSFDVVLVHPDAIAWPVPKIDNFTPNLYRV
jgi:hypothetical protein